MAANLGQPCEEIVSGMLGDPSEWTSWHLLMINEWCRARFPEGAIAYAVRMQRQMRKLLLDIAKLTNVDPRRIERAKRQVRSGMLAIDALSAYERGLSEEDKVEPPVFQPLKGDLLEYENLPRTGYDKGLARAESDAVIAILRGVYALLTTMRALDLTHELNDVLRAKAIADLYAGAPFANVLSDVLKALKTAPAVAQPALAKPTW